MSGNDRRFTRANGRNIKKEREDPETETDKSAEDEATFVTPAKNLTRSQSFDTPQQPKAQGKMTIKMLQGTMNAEFHAVRQLLDNLKTQQAEQDRQGRQLQTNVHNYSCRPFRGTFGDPPTAFIEEYEDMATVQNWDDARKIRTIRVFLKDSAVVLYNTLTADEQASIGPQVGPADARTNPDPAWNVARAALLRVL